MKIFIQTPDGFDNDLNNHTISHLSYFDFLSKKRSMSDFIRNGISGSSLYAKLLNPFYFHKLYLDKDKSYFNYLHSFKERFVDYDVIVMNPGVDLVHPEFLKKHFSNSLKCLHFIDDPHASYSYGFPYAWAFDCATYISPSYNEYLNMSEILELVGFKFTKWVPHCITNIDRPKYTINELENQLLSRNNKALYVGAFYTGKNSRLIKLKNKLKNNLDIYGRYPLSGYSFALLSTYKGYPSLYKVRKISNRLREKYYSQYSIGLNMHLSDPARETGNARLYELAYRGLAQVVDNGQYSMLEKIFEPENEILTYSNVTECCEQIKRLQLNKDLRIKIAINGYKRAIEKYNYQDRLLNLIEWFKSIRENNF